MPIVGTRKFNDTTRHLRELGMQLNLWRRRAAELPEQAATIRERVRNYEQVLRDELLRATKITLVEHGYTSCAAMQWAVNDPDLLATLFEPLAFFRECLDSPGVATVLAYRPLFVLVPEHERVPFVQAILDRYLIGGEDWTQTLFAIGVDRATIGRLVLENIRRAVHIGGHDGQKVLAKFVQGSAFYDYTNGCQYPVSSSWMVLSRRQLYRALMLCAVHAPEAFLRLDYDYRRHTTISQMSLRLSQAQLTKILVCASRHASSLESVAFRVLDCLPAAARRAMLWRLGEGTFTALLYMMFTDPDMQYAIRYLEVSLRSYEQVMSAYRDWHDTTDLPGEMLVDDPLNPATRLHNGLLRNPELVAQIEQVIERLVFVAEAGTDMCGDEIVVDVPGPDGNTVRYVQHPFEMSYSPKPGDYVLGHCHDPRNVELDGGVIGAYLVPMRESKPVTLGFR